jgi:hypothetical protein
MLGVPLEVRVLQFEKLRFEEKAREKRAIDNIHLGPRRCSYLLCVTSTTLSVFQAIWLGEFKDL